MTPQTPPTDRPLTAGDWTARAEKLTAQANAMREMLHRLGVANTRTITDGAMAVEFVRLIGTPSRPATSAASEGAVDRVMAVLNHWFDGRARIDRNSDMVAQLAALASPPVSERERELEGALRKIADGWDVIESSGSMGEMTLQAPDDWEGDQTEIVVKFHGLTAQPAGEGG